MNIQTTDKYFFICYYFFISQKNIKFSFLNTFQYSQIQYIKVLQIKNCLLLLYLHRAEADCSELK